MVFITCMQSKQQYQDSGAQHLNYQENTIDNQFNFQHTNPLFNDYTTITNPLFQTQPIFNETKSTFNLVPKCTTRQCVKQCFKYIVIGKFFKQACTSIPLQNLLNSIFQFNASFLFKLGFSIILFFAIVNKFNGFQNENDLNDFQNENVDQYSEFETYADSVMSDYQQNAKLIFPTSTVYVNIPICEHNDNLQLMAFDNLESVVQNVINNTDQYFSTMQNNSNGHQEVLIQILCAHIARYNQELAKYLYDVLMQQVQQNKRIQLTQEHLLKNITVEYQQQILNLDQQTRNFMDYTLNLFNQVQAQHNILIEKQVVEKQKYLEQLKIFFGQITTLNNDSFNNSLQLKLQEQDMSELKMSIQESAENYNRIFSQLRQLQLEFTTFDSKISIAVKNYIKQEKLIARMRDQEQNVQQLQNFMQMYQKLLQEIQEFDIFALLKELQEQTKDFDQVQKTYKKEQNELQTKMFSIEKILHSTKQEISTVKKQHAQHVKILDEQKQQQSTQYQDLKEDIQKLYLNEKTYTEQNTLQVQQNSEMQSKVLSMQKNYTQILDKIKSLEDANALFEIKFKTQQSKIQSLQTKQDDKKRDIDTLKLSINELEKTSHGNVSKVKEEKTCENEKQNMEKSFGSIHLQNKSSSKSKHKKKYKSKHNSDSEGGSSSEQSSSSSDSEFSSSDDENSSNKRKRKKNKVQSVLGEFKIEKYNGTSDPKQWFKLFENKAELHYLFESSNKKRLINELYFATQDKVREYFEEKRLLKKSYKYAKQKICEKFKKDTRKANHKISLIRQKQGEKINEYFDNLKRFAKNNGVHDEIVRDTFLQNLNVYGISQYVESLQLQCEQNNEYSSYDVRDKVLSYVEKYRSYEKFKNNDRYTKQNNDTNNDKNFKKDFKPQKYKQQKRINALGVEETILVQISESEQDIQDTQQPQHTENNEQMQLFACDEIGYESDAEQNKSVKNSCVLIKQVQKMDDQNVSQNELINIQNMQKSHVKNGKQLFDNLSKLVQEGKKVPLIDVAKHNKYNIMHIPQLQLLSENPTQMLSHINQLIEVFCQDTNLYNTKDIIETLQVLKDKIFQKYTEVFKKEIQLESSSLNVSALSTYKAKSWEQLLYINVWVQNQKCQALIDSGSQVCAISRTFLEKNKWLQDKVVQCHEKVHTASGQSDNLTQKLCNVNISLNKEVEVQLDLYVTNATIYDILLGRNMINSINGKIQQNGFEFLDKYFTKAQEQKHSNVLVCNMLSTQNQQNKTNAYYQTQKPSLNTQAQNKNKLENFNVNSQEYLQYRQGVNQKLFPNFPLTEKFQFLYVDPPYDYGAHSKYCKPTYDVISDTYLYYFGDYIKQISDVNCVLIMWTTSPKLDFALKLLKSWGFTYKTKFLEWVKLDENNQEVVNPGRFNSNTTETLLIATKGNTKHFLKDSIVKQVMYETRGKHSEKPMLTYDKFAQKFKLQDLNCLEIFARKVPPYPFNAYGNELQQRYIPKNKSSQQDLEKIVFMQGFQKFLQHVQKHNLTQEEIDSRVRTLLEKISNKNIRSFIQPLIVQYIDIFAFSKSEIGNTPLMECEIKLQPGTIPVKKQPYRLSTIEYDFLKNEIDTLLKLGFIEPCQADWALPVILVRKGDKDFRMCIDFRPLNKHTISEVWVLNRIDQIFSKLSGYKYFSKLDGKSGYYHMTIAEKDRNKTAFICQFGVFRFIRMPFGLKNAPFYFCRLMDMILKTYVDKFVQIYIDDIIVFSKTKEEHFIHLQKVFEALRTADIKLGPDKCELLQTEICLLGHKIKQNTILPLESRVEAITKMQVPINRTQLRHFLGLCSYYRQYIKDFSIIAKPLYDLTQESKKYHWDVVEQQAFDALKHALTQKPFLALPKNDCKFLLQTDYSENGLGAILSQRQKDGKELVIEYASRVLRGAEKNYIAFEGEVLAIHWSLSKFRHYLLGQEFELYTDNKSLQTVLDRETLSKKIIRWLIDLSEYSFIAKHRPGKQNQNADALSRLPISKQKISKQQQLKELPNDVVKKHLQQVLEKSKTYVCALKGNPNIFTFPDIGDISCNLCNKKHSLDENPILICDMCATGFHRVCVQLADVPEYFWYCSACEQKIQDKLKKGDVIDITIDIPTLQYLQNSNMQFKNEEQKFRVQRRASRYFFKNGQLWVYTTHGEKIVPSFSVHQLLMIERHEQQCHGGFESLYNALTQDFYWFQMKGDCQTLVRNCVECIRLRPTFSPHETYTPTDKGNQPFSTICIDLATNLPKTKNNNIHIIIAIDSFSKWVELQPIPDRSSKGIALWFYRDIVCRHGAPQAVRTDQGTEFLGDLETLLKILNIPLLKISVGNPQANGQVERYVNTVKQMLMRLINTQDMQWDNGLPTIALTLRSNIQQATNLSPYQIIYGRQMNLPSSVISKNIVVKDVPTKEDINQYVKNLQQNQTYVTQKVFQNLKNVDKKRQDNYEKKLFQATRKIFNPKNLLKNDQVYVKRMRKNALESPTSGPFLFQSYTSNSKLACKILNPITNRVSVVSTSKIVVGKRVVDEKEYFLYE